MHKVMGLEEYEAFKYEVRLDLGDCLEAVVTLDATKSSYKQYTHGYVSD